MDRHVYFWHRHQMFFLTALLQHSKCASKLSYSRRPPWYCIHIHFNLQIYPIAIYCSEGSKLANSLNFAVIGTRDVVIYSYFIYHLTGVVGWQDCWLCVIEVSACWCGKDNEVCMCSGMQGNRWCYLVRLPKKPSA